MTNKTQLAYLGPPGTFSEQAAINFNADAELIPFPSIQESIESLLTESADQAIVPFENAIAGSVGETHDLILRHHNIFIAGELILPVEHCLIAKQSGVLRQEIRLIVSHPQALSQCYQYLQNRFPRVQTQAVNSTAGAVEQVVKQGDEGIVAIAPYRAAEVYGAHILEQGIQDSQRNATRFIILARQDSEPTGQDKTTIVFSTLNKPGALYSVLEVFANNAVNLTRIESRPTRGRHLGEYTFLLDCDGHRLDSTLNKALSDLQSQGVNFRVIGSYPHHRS